MGHIAARTPGMWPHMSRDVWVAGQAFDPLNTLVAALFQESGAAFVVAVVAVESEFEGNLLTHDLVDIGLADILDDAPLQVIAGRIVSLNCNLRHGLVHLRFLFTLHIQRISGQEVCLDLITAVMGVDGQLSEGIVGLMQRSAATPTACDVLITADFVEPGAKLTRLEMLVVVLAKRTSGSNVGLHDDWSKDIVQLVLHVPHALPLRSDRPNLLAVALLRATFFATPLFTTLHSWVQSAELGWSQACVAC
jgi:hypothetical protein